MEHFKHLNMTLAIQKGNIVDQPDIDVIVNAANAQLRRGGGVAGAIHGVGDPQLTEETRPLAPINPGEAVITSAPNLPNKKIIHVLGPVYGRDKPEEEILASCYRKAMKIADEYGMASIAFPAISTGAFGYPTKDAAEIALKTIFSVAGQFEKLTTVRFVLFSKRDYTIHKDALMKVSESFT